MSKKNLKKLETYVRESKKESYKPIISRKTDFQNIKGTNCYQYSRTQEVFHEFFLRNLLKNKHLKIKMTRKTLT